MALTIACGLPPGPDTVDHARLAEQLGYHRVWLFDSPPLWQDVWARMALVAEHTDRILLGASVLIPSLRHPMTQAAAIATIESIAPGRLSVGIATGFTGRNAMGQKRLSWAFVRRYALQVKGLLAGDAVEIEGKMARLIPSDGFMPPRPIRVPVLLGTNGPKGCAIAREIADGIISSGAPPERGFAFAAALNFGTVLDDGEPLDSPRVRDAAGAAVAVRYHARYEIKPTAVDRLPGGRAWRDELERVPEAMRHLTLHQGHAVDLSNGIDEHAIDMSRAKELSFTGTPDELRARLVALEAAGATEIIYGPAGSDVPRELRRFAEVAGLPDR